MATTKRPGRPLKPIEEKPQQFSIRLKRKQKIGLEILAADMQVSLSQAVEMAVDAMFEREKLTNGKTVAEVLQQFPPNPTEAETVLLTYMHVPGALPMPLRLTARMVFESKEMGEALSKSPSLPAVWEVISWSSTKWPVLKQLARDRGMRVDGLNLHAEVHKLLDELIDDSAPERKRAGGLF